MNRLDRIGGVTFFERYRLWETLLKVENTSKKIKNPCISYYPFKFLILKFKYFYIKWNKEKPLTCSFYK